MRWFAAPLALIWWIAGLAPVEVGAVIVQAPPTRLFGTVTVDGATPPLGTRVEARIDGRACGEGVVRQLGGDFGTGYVVDVLADAVESGCGTDGKTVTLRVGGREAAQTATFETGAFTRLDLSVSGAIQTPTPGPTPPPFAAQTPAPAATPPPGGTTGTPAPAAATPSPVPAASPTPAPAPQATATPEGTATPEATPSPSPAADASPSPSASPTPPGASIGTVTPEEENEEDGGIPAALWALLALAAIAAAGTGVYLYRRGRGGAEAP